MLLLTLPTIALKILANHSFWEQEVLSIVRIPRCVKQGLHEHSKSELLGGLGRKPASSLATLPLAEVPEDALGLLQLGKLVKEGGEGAGRVGGRGRDGLRRVEGAVGGHLWPAPHKARLGQDDARSHTTAKLPDLLE